MPMIYRGSGAEAIAAWILDAAGATTNLAGMTGVVTFYDPTTGIADPDAGGTVVCSAGTGDGETAADDPNIVITLTVDDLPPNSRWRMLVDVTIGATHLVRTWPFVVRPGLPVS